MGGKKVLWCTKNLNQLCLVQKSLQSWTQKAISFVTQIGTAIIINNAKNTDINEDRPRPY